MWTHKRLLKGNCEECGSDLSDSPDWGNDYDDNDDLNYDDFDEYGYADDGYFD